ncbi:hypothetical protein IE81DRAFT_367370 [Ceraceosorus guamensis]|uniref:Uncharacterized protein n=1 Tax=Ceraceosorus guamensis TaxID=1522189 RepID=A0A316VVA1_9BASI|nr:hypothetical protein IE81DRAFT_367370 [Ceraceosorus guamensis]PWN41557.1 hypothetical protein IE81DRAFT_367370 [Ceraceosorus guamensis]
MLATKTLLMPFAALALASTVIGLPQPQTNEKSSAVFHPVDPNQDPNVQQGPDLQIYITSADAYCLFLPETENTTIAQSIHRNKAISACRKPWAPEEQVQLDDGFFTTNQSHPFVDNTAGVDRGRQIHLWGCINPYSMPNNIVPTDSRGGVYHGRIHGNDQVPARGVCLGYDHFTQWIIPAAGVISYKCCQDPIDCPRWDVGGDIGKTIPDSGFIPADCKKLIPGGNAGSRQSASASSKSASVGGALAAFDEDGKPIAVTSSKSKNENEANAWADDGHH